MTKNESTNTRKRLIAIFLLCSLCFLFLLSTSIFQSLRGYFSLLSKPHSKTTNTKVKHPPQQKEVQGKPIPMQKKPRKHSGKQPRPKKKGTKKKLPRTTVPLFRAKKSKPQKPSHRSFPDSSLSKSIKIPIGKRIVYTERSTLTTLNPLFTTSGLEARMTQLLFEGLVSFDDKGKPQPSLEKSWKISARKDSIEFRLRKNVRWHDGKPFTAKDVLFTMRVWLQKKHRFFGRFLASHVKKLEKQGSHKVSIRFHKPIVNIAKWFSFFILPSHRFQDRVSSVTSTHRFSYQPVGTGMFRFFEKKSRSVRLIRFTKHRKKPKGNIAMLTLSNIYSLDIQSEVYRYGGSQVMFHIPPKDISSMEKRTDTNLQPARRNAWWYIGFNLKHPILQDKLVREAILLALHRNKLRDNHTLDGTTISGPFHPQSPFYNVAVKKRTQDLSRSKKLLTLAGWKGHGLRKKNGKILELSLLIPARYSTYQALFREMLDSLRKVGLKASITWTKSHIEKHNLQRGKFAFYVDEWGKEAPHMMRPEVLRAWFHSKGKKNFFGYNSPIVDKLFLQTEQVSEPLLYKRIFQQIHKQIHQDLPIATLWQLTNYAALSTKLKNVVIAPNNFFKTINRWVLDDRKK